MEKRIKKNDAAIYQHKIHDDNSCFVHQCKRQWQNHTTLKRTKPVMGIRTQVIKLPLSFYLIDQLKDIEVSSFGHFGVCPHIAHHQPYAKLLLYIQLSLFFPPSPPLK